MHSFRLSIGKVLERMGAQDESAQYQHHQSRLLRRVPYHAQIFQFHQVFYSYI
jgi:hypothetical protein